MLVSNDIDRASTTGLVTYLNTKGFNVLESSPDDLESHKKEKNMILIGGPDAPDGMGRIVKETGLLDIDDADLIRTAGNHQLYAGHDIWNPGQRVWILAGSSRVETQNALETYRDEVVEQLLP